MADQTPPIGRRFGFVGFVGSVKATSYDQWTLSVNSENRHPFRPNPDPEKNPEVSPTLGMISAGIPGRHMAQYAFPHSGVSGAPSSVRLKIRRHSARRGSSGFVTVSIRSSNDLAYSTWN